MNYTYEKVDVGGVKMFVRGQHFAKIGDAYWGFNEGYFTAPGCGSIPANYATNHGLEIYIRVPVAPKKYRLEVLDNYRYRVFSNGEELGAMGYSDSIGRLGNGSFTITEGWADAE